MKLQTKWCKRINFYNDQYNFRCQCSDITICCLNCRYNTRVFAYCAWGGDFMVCWYDVYWLFRENKLNTLWRFCGIIVRTFLGKSYWLGKCHMPDWVWSLIYSFHQTSDSSCTHRVILPRSTLIQWSFTNNHWWRAIHRPIVLGNNLLNFYLISLVDSLKNENFDLADNSRNILHYLLDDCCHSDILHKQRYCSRSIKVVAKSKMGQFKL